MCSSCRRPCGLPYMSSGVVADRFLFVGICEIWRMVKGRWVWTNHRWPRRAVYTWVGAQYVTAATKVAIVGWLFRESAGRLACTDWSLQCLLHSLLTLCFLGFWVPGECSCQSAVSTLLGMVLSVAFVCFGSGDRRNVCWGRSFFYLVRGISKTPCYCCWLFVPGVGAAARFSCVCGFGCSGVSLFAWVLWHFLFGFISLSFLSPLGSSGVGGQHCWKRVIPGGLRLVM